MEKHIEQSLEDLQIYRQALIKIGEILVNTEWYDSDGDALDDIADVVSGVAKARGLVK